MKSLRNDQPELDLLKLDELYCNLLKSCNYASEIILTKNEIDNICSVLKDYTGYIRTNRVNNLLTVLAVNIAYFYYDEEGFWKHFFDICKFKSDILSDEIGYHIEKTLYNFELISEIRSGPFRYVGAILEQCGVTRRNIPFFAFMIQNAIKTYGYKEIINFTYEKYCYLVEDICHSKYLREYLVDKAGREFTMYIIKILYLIECRTISLQEATTFKGMHPEFWQEFMKYYKLQYKAQKRTIHESFLKPVLLFNQQDMHLFIKFPSSYYTIDSENFHNNSSKIYIPITNSNQLVSNYTGKIVKNGSIISQWGINGWDPQKEKCAYFHERYGYIDSVNEHIYGKYYIITQDDSSIPISINKKRIGKLNITSNCDFSVYTAIIEKNSNSVEKVELKWSNEDSKISFISYYDIFLNKLPEIIITNKELLFKDSVMLLFDVGNGERRIKDYKNLIELKNDIKDKKVYKGSIWTETMQRTRYKDSEYRQFLNFCVIPEFQLSLPDRLYNSDEKVQFISSSKFIRYENCIKLSSDNMSWLVPSDQSIIKGKVYLENEDIEINYPVYRAGLTINSDNDITFLNYNNIDDVFEVKLCGVPNSEVDLVIRNCDEEIILLNNIEFDTLGTVILNSRKIKNLLKNTVIDVGEFYLKYNNKIYNTGKRIINFNYIMIELANNSNVDKIIEHVYNVDKNSGLKLSQIYNISQNRLNTIEFLKEENYTKDLDKFYKVFILLANQFDGTIIVNNNMDEITSAIEEKYPDIYKTISWYRRSLNVLKGEKTEQILIAIKEYEQLSWIPESCRWKSEILDLSNRLKSQSNIIDLIADWSDEIKKKAMYGFKSNLSLRKYGTNLSKAWVQYLKDNVTESIECLEKIGNDVDNLTLDLKTTLLAIIYAKSNRFFAIQKLLENYNNYTVELSGIFNIYKSISDLVINNKLNYENNELDSNLKILPLKIEDTNFIITSNRILSGEIDFNRSIKLENYDNWMDIFIICKYLKNKGKISNELLKKLKSFINNIPDSPEKGDLLKDLG